MRRPLIVAAATISALALLTACGTGGAAPQPTSTGGISTDITDDPVTLTISYVSDPPITPLVDGFTELHPNVTVELVQTPFADYQTSLKLALASNDAPDIVQYSPGPMRAIVPAGLVLPLDEYAEAYGWRDRVSPSLLGMLTSDEEATQYGAGNLYAMPGAIQLIGVFYNKKLTAAAGVKDTPATLEEFADDLAAVKDSGVVPLSLPALGVGGFQLWAALANVTADVDAFNQWVFGEPDATLEDDPGFAEAAGLIQEWSAAGYFPTGASAIADADAIAAFTGGEQAYFLTGNWNAKAFADALGDDLGFFLVPGVEAGQAAVATGSGFPYSISSKSENQDVAAAFLDYISSEAAAPGVFESGFVPVIPDPGASTDSVQGVIQGSYEEVVDGAGIAPFANWATSSMIDALTAGVQGLLSGNLTPEAYIASLQADWESNRP